MLITHYKNWEWLKEVNIKYGTCRYIDDIIKIEDFDRIDKKSYKKFWFMGVHTKLRLVQNHCLLDLMK